MATYSRVLLSGSTQGRQIKVVQTSTLGTAIHSTGTSATIIDEIWLWATNSSTAALKLTIEFGAAASPDDLIEITIPPESGPILVVPGLCLTGSGAAAAVVTAFAASANLVLISGYVNRITP